MTTIEQMANHLELLTEFSLYEEIGVREAARILGISEETLRQRCRRGEAPFIPDGGPQWRFIKRDIVFRRHRSIWGKLKSL